MKPKTVQGFIGTLRTALRQAVAWGLLTVDPTAGLRTPKVPRKQREVLTPEELQAVLDAAREYKYHLVIRLLAVTGARLGEILGLKWLDIDLKKATLTIVRSADSRNRVLNDEPKTEAGNRTIKLDAMTVGLLTEAKKSLGNDYRRHALVFSVNGRVVREMAVRRTMARVLKRAGIHHICIHDLRHGAGSLLLDNGHSLPTVSAFLGHSSPATTAAIYAHKMRGGTSIADLLPPSGQ